mgnify:CR=1 FL=1
MGRWVFDPIDGTRSFITGNPVYATLIAVRVDGDEVACAVEGERVAVAAAARPGGQLILMAAPGTARRAAHHPENTQQGSAADQAARRANDGTPGRGSEGEAW